MRYDPRRQVESYVQIFCFSLIWSQVLSWLHIFSSFEDSFLNHK